MKAIRGYDTEEHPDQFDPEGWTDYWDEGTWEHCNDNYNQDDPESEANDKLFMECILFTKLF